MKVGICGFAKSQATIFRDLRLLEVQGTFDRPPRLETVKRWRSRAPSGFEFTAKAWQVITHEPTSPTYRKGGLAIPEGRRDRYGAFRPTEEVFSAWDRTREVCEALGARFVVFQIGRAHV